MPEFTSNWLSENKLKHWRKHLSHLQDFEVRVLEIGSYEGRSALWFAENLCKQPGSVIWCVDPWVHSEVEDRFIQNTHHNSKIIKRKGFSHDVLRIFRHDHFDVAYIDGSHDAQAVIEDAVHCFRLVKSGGIIIFDDVLWKNPNNWPCNILPEPAVRAFLELYRHHIQVLHDGYQVIVRKL